MTTIAVGTEKGGFIIDDDRLQEHILPGWKVTAFGKAPDGTYLLGVASNWFGAAVHRSKDLSTWEQTETGPSWPEGSDRKLNQIWFFTNVDGVFYCGVDDAGLFTSQDGGITWDPVESLNEHPSRTSWVPGAGGMCAHRLLAAGEQLWLGISAVGVFRSDDGGRTFQRKDEGVVPVVTPEEGGENGWCVHGLAPDPASPNRIWRQDHSGVYRTESSGDQWERIENGLPSGFGFPIVRDANTGALFVVPLEAATNRLPVEGRFAAYRTTDGGDSWHVAGKGWPDAETYAGVLRGAMTADGDGGVYIGNTSGNVWLTNDAGESWRALPFSFPRINSVAVF